MRTKTFLPLALVLSLVLSLFPVGITSAAPAAFQRIQLASRGVTSFKAVASATQESLGNMPNTLKGQIGNSDLLEREIPRGETDSRFGAQAMTPALISPVAKASSVVGQPGAGFRGWNGLTHFDQRMANNGNQWTLEPPDQGLCAGAGYVLEAVNDALTVYDTHGKVQKGVTDINTFFGYPAAIDRTNAIYGPMVTDPKCVFDATTNRWFLTILTLDQDRTSGNFSGSTHVDIAVSKTPDPTGDWSVYTLDTTDGDGSLTGHTGCPCLGDQPLIGFNQDAFIVTTNEFSLAGSAFNGAQVYAISKRALINNQPVTGVHFDNLSLAEGQAYSLQPAVPNTPRALSKLQSTVYFLSALQFTGVLDNRIAVWALTGTDTLDSSSPNLSLNSKVLTSEVYGTPPPAVQKVGDIPLGSSLKQPENALNSNDDRMNQAQFTGDKLYGALNTLVNVGGKQQTGIAYFIVSPGVKNGQPVGKIVDQGYVAVANNNVMFPSIAVAKNGRAVMAFSLVGPDYYPSAAFSALGQAPDVFVAASGTEAADGLTGYPALGGDGLERWGDYSAAVTDGSTIWMANEFTPGGPRTQYANWGTFVYKVNP